jgi:hypothetical protein
LKRLVPRNAKSGTDALNELIADGCISGERPYRLLKPFDGGHDSEVA